MNKQLIQNTAVCRKDDQTFVVQSPLLSVALGISPDFNEAWKTFDQSLDELQNREADGFGVAELEPSRAKMQSANLNCSVRRKSKITIEALAKELQCSPGEVVDYLVAVFKSAQTYPCASIFRPGLEGLACDTE